ncbi:TonB-dependent receptor [Neolewinella antarctica]|uniref:TonB-dependent receptor plug domain-containing protein n=1 Tax=Neolewinella antarctica TaxID=442734 RepID=A0ABX0X7C5_9BACT|nr:TonB-dependent receptor plug domain-containing protein [Neolewinella antarctica]NJC24889.1 hypothetical protein [Neolewinella antarctica]
MKKILLTFLLFVISYYLPAQQLSGVISGEGVGTLPGAYLSVVGTQKHVHTDSRGHFTFPEATLGDTLVITYLGFAEVRAVVSDLNEKMSLTLVTGAVDLGQVTVRDSEAGTSVISNIDLVINPVQSSQELLRRVPGLFIGQHAGGGKAEQIFLRGFDIDHGTDIAISVDGLPVNMVSHAHGQGYADLHFLIPESVQRIDFAKGPYAADRGNFATAGYVAFQTKNRLAENIVTVEGGQFGYGRFLTGLNLLETAKSNAYFMTEYTRNDGPFDSPQNFRRLNALGKFTSELASGDRISLTASHFTSDWDASGQIPLRAVASGRISRFGAIDDTEGGTTSRSNLLLKYTKDIDRATFLTATAGYSRYEFELFSNFTFFLEDPDFGDQIRQREVRDLFVTSLELQHRNFSIGDAADFRVGVNLRSDRTKDSHLANTVNRREVQNYLQRGDVTEDNFSAYADARIELGAFTFNPGLRYDLFTFDYVDALSQTFVRATDAAARFSPKFNVYYDAGPRTQIFVKTGVGFHSNDTRVVTDRVLGRSALPKALGADAGAVFKPFERLYVETALWYLHLDQEFVYVGDAGVVEPSGRTRRYGFDLSARYQLTDWLYGDVDATHTIARSTDSPEGGNRIPLAPTTTLAGGLSAAHNDWRGCLRGRYLANRPANEDNSIIAKGYVVIDATLTKSWRNFSFSLTAENVLDTEWNEAQFATESRLAGETTSVEEIHFTPGLPFWVKGGVTYTF